MKLVLVGVLIVASAGLALAQPDQSKCQDRALKVAEDYRRTGTAHRPVTDGMVKLVAETVRRELIAAIREHTGIGVAADCIESRSPRDFRAQGNVTVTVGDIVITAEEAVLEKGEIQLTGNSRVRLSGK